MANIMDYLDWRGDLCLSRNIFNDVDALILACLSYVDFSGIVPEISKGDIKLKDAAKIFFRMHSKQELESDKSFVAFAPQLLEKMSNTRRFSNLNLCNFVDIVDSRKVLQFSALEIKLNKDISYISIRGTDDTLIGWREDFDIAYKQIPAQKASVKYLEKIAESTGRKYFVGGHSKGGHLAMYCSSCVKKDLNNRILKVFSFDGPGFNEDFIDTKKIDEISNRVVRIIPDTSVIGMLLINPIKAIVVKSSNYGLMQHDALSWEIMGKDFVTQENLSKTGQEIEKTFTTWILNIAMEDRKAFIDDIWKVLDATNETLLSHIYDGGLTTYKKMLEQLSNLDENTHAYVSDLLKLIKMQRRERLLDGMNRFFNNDKND